MVAKHCVLLIVIALYAVACGGDTVTVPANSTNAPPPDEVAPETPTDTGSTGEIALPPPGIEAFQQYLDVIGGRRGHGDEVVVEGTVLSLTRNEVCPYPVEACPIPPYPSDWGQVRIDAVTVNGGGQAVEEGDGATGDEDGASMSGNQGQELPAENLPAALAPGDEVEAQFLLTTAPTRVVYAPAPGESGGQEMAAPPDEAPAGAPNADPTYAPLPQSDGYFIFTVGTTSAGGAKTTTLPGLAAGDRFRATAFFDGVLRVMTYDRLP